MVSLCGNLGTALWASPVKTCSNGADEDLVVCGGCFLSKNGGTFNEGKSRGGSDTLFEESSTGGSLAHVFFGGFGLMGDPVQNESKFMELPVVDWVVGFPRHDRSPFPGGFP